MRQQRISVAIIYVMILLGAPVEDASCQYWSEGVLEKSFEHTDFFFVPNNINPFGIGNFAKLFNVLFLVNPKFKDSYNGPELSDFQWWIGLNLFP